MMAATCMMLEHTPSSSLVSSSVNASAGGSCNASCMYDYWLISSSISILFGDTSADGRGRSRNFFSGEGSRVIKRGVPTSKILIKGAY